MSRVRWDGLMRCSHPSQLLGIGVCPTGRELPIPGMHIAVVNHPVRPGGLYSGAGRRFGD
jgi:hypothetical protein